MIKLVDILNEGTRCWKGYKKKGMKTMFGKRVPNCVKRESIAPNHDGKAAPYGSGYDAIDEILKIDGKTVKAIRTNGSQDPEKYEIEYTDGTIEPYLDHIRGDRRAAVQEDLRNWVKQKWVRIGPDGKIRGSCGGKKKGEGKPKCLPLAKARAMGKKKRASAARRKRREDPNPDRRGKAKNVSTYRKKKKKS
tara:strand:- start:5319 stop:5894 length:576 start_codon:yes stop_codon:yes gene_type:complete